MTSIVTPNRVFNNARLAPHKSSEYNNVQFMLRQSHRDVKARLLQNLCRAKLNSVILYPLIVTSGLNHSAVQWDFSGRYILH